MFLVLSVTASVATPAAAVAPLAESIRYAPSPPPAQQGRKFTPARARANLATYVTHDDYPAEAIRHAEEGTTAFRLDIGPDGRVTRCTITASNGSAVLDQTTCRLMLSRPRFTPARNERERPTTDSMNARIRWVLPQIWTMPDLVITRFVIGKDGIARSCQGILRYHGREERKLDAPACEAPAHTQQLIALLKGQSVNAETRIWQETRLIRDAAAPWPAFENSKDRIVAQTRVRLLVEPGGRISSCVVLDSTSLLGIPPQPCRRFRQIADDGRTQATEMRLISFLIFEGEGKSP